MSALGVLYNPLLPQGSLLDAIKFSETGHLSDDKALTAVSPKGAVGPYQFMQKFMHDFGYGMPKNIPMADVQNMAKSRQLADRFVSGYTQHHKFETPIEKLVAYNAGPQYAAVWKAAGSNIADLPAETQKYIQKAAAFLTRKGKDDMSYLGYPSETDPNRTIGGTVIGPSGLSSGPRMSLEDDYQMGKRTGQFIYAENYERFEREMSPQPMTATPAQTDEAAGLTMAMPNPPRPGLTTGFYNPNAVARQVAGGPVTAPAAPQAMAMPSEDDATLNIDGSQVGQDALLYTVPQTVGGALSSAMSAGQNAQPQNAPPPALAPSDDVVQSNAALMQAMGINPAQAASSSPALTYSSTPSRSTGSGQVSQNRRDMSAMSMVPSPQEIGFNEMLIRMGAAGLAGSAEGGLQALGAIGDTYGQIQDANRATGLAAYQAQMEAMADGSTAKGREERLTQAGKIDDTLFDMQRALNALESGQSVTGWFDSTVGAVWDDVMGNPESGTRLLLKKLKVDDALLRVAQTKGSISNSEMKMFLDPAPKDTQDEKVWMQWIRDRMVVLQKVRQRLATGETVADVASQQQIDQFSGNQSGGDYQLTEDDNALINRVLNQ